MHHYSSRHALLLILVCTYACFPLAFEQEFGNNSFYAEFEDPYYVCSGLYLSLSDVAIPKLAARSELQIYNQMLASAFEPNIFLIEAGAYPLPLSGVAARSWLPDYYAQATIANTNIIRAITESVNFKEPWSVSFFAGHLANFADADSTVKGRANIGLLGSYGYYHIKDNQLVGDHWGEFELKLKVDRNGIDRHYATSYRIGSRVHSNQDILNIFYIGLKRDRTDFDEEGFSLIKNTNIQVRADFSLQPLQALMLTLEAGKKYPFKVDGKTYMIGLSIGFTWNINNPYAGELGAGFIQNSIGPVINPMIKF